MSHLQFIGNMSLIILNKLLVNSGPNVGLIYLSLFSSNHHNVTLRLIVGSCGIWPDYCRCPFIFNTLLCTPLSDVIISNIFQSTYCLSMFTILLNHFLCICGLIFSILYFSRSINIYKYHLEILFCSLCFYQCSW